MNLKTTSTSRNSEIGQDIPLRTTSITQLIFRPMVIDNPHNKKASVKGTFIYQKKDSKGQWQDYKTLDLNKLKIGEWIKLELKSEELLTLITELDKYYQIFDKYGIVSGVANYTIRSSDVESVIKKLLESPENLEAIKKLKIEDLKKLNLISTISSFKDVLNTWNNNKKNGNENFWQNFFSANSWVIAQTFSCPTILFQGKAYVGGKSIDNKGGKVVDLIYQNRLTKNILVVEIKTPITKLLGTLYRDNIYPVSSDLSGSIAQILRYEDELQKNYHALLKSSETFTVLNPKCLVIIGSLNNENFSREQKESFELYRNDSKQIEIITFDELFGKIELLIDLLEK